MAYFDLFTLPKEEPLYKDKEELAFLALFQESQL